MANTNTALIVPEFSATRQADINNGQPVAYPQYKHIEYCDITSKEVRTKRVKTGNRFVQPGQVIGRLYFPKAHSQKSKSWFFDKVITVYDSWKGNGFLGWTNNNNSKRVVQFILKPGVDPSIWLEIAKNYVCSNLNLVRATTDFILESFKSFARNTVAKVQTVVAEFVYPEPEVQPVTHPTQFLLPPALFPKASIVKVQDFISQSLNKETITPTLEKEQTNSVPLLLPKRSDYSFTLKYKPRTYKRLTKYFKLDVQLSKENAIDVFIQNCISPYAIKRVLTPKRKK